MHTVQCAIHDFNSHLKMYFCSRHKPQNLRHLENTKNQECEADFD